MAERSLQHNSTVPRSTSRRRDPSSRAAALPTSPLSQTPSTFRSSRISSSSSSSQASSYRRASSSRTSFEDDRNEASYYRLKGRSRSVPQKRDPSPEPQETSQDDSGALVGHGYALWGRVTSVASKLTVNVSQAWQKSIHLVDGETTPPGEDSRLTKAMKAYHLSRARTPADLPAWLFNEQERGLGSKSLGQTASDEQYKDRFHPDTYSGTRARVGGSGLREVYNRAASESSSRPTAPSRSTFDQPTQSRAADRLKAIRDAKRSGMQIDIITSPSNSSALDDSHNNYRSPTTRQRVVGRVGLPSGPAARVRAP